MKCTVFQVFPCVFNVFSLQKHVLLVYFTCIQKYTCTIYKTWNSQFFKCFHVFLMCFHCRNMYFWYISHVYKNTHHVLNMKCTVLLVFSYVFTAETFTFGKFNIYTKIHMYHIFYMKCTVLLAFSCDFTVFSLQKHILLVHFTCIQKYTFTIYYIW
jgi:hypothetical protein